MFIGIILIISCFFKSQAIKFAIRAFVLCYKPVLVFKLLLKPPLVLMLSKVINSIAYVGLFSFNLLLIDLFWVPG